MRKKSAEAQRAKADHPVAGREDLLQSVHAPHRRYIGLTQDLKPRLADHNASRSDHTAQFRPWNLAAYHAFADPKKAKAFESYLKSGSGRACANKHFW